MKYLNKKLYQKPMIEIHEFEDWPTQEIDELLLDVQFIPPMPKVIKEGDI